MDESGKGLENHPFLRQELLEDRDTLLQKEIPPLEEVLREAEAALERACNAPVYCIPRRECRGQCHPCRIREGRLDCATTKSRECFFAVEFSAFRAGTPDTPSPAEAYRPIPPPEVIRTRLVKQAHLHVDALRNKLSALYRRVAQIDDQLDRLTTTEQKEIPPPSL